MTYDDLVKRQNSLIEAVMPYISDFSVNSNISDDAPEEIKEKYNEMLSLTPQIMALSYLR